MCMEEVDTREWGNLEKMPVGNKGKGRNGAVDGLDVWAI